MKSVLSYINKVGPINLLFVLLTLLDVVNYGYLFGYVAIGLIFLKKDAIKYGLDSFFFTIVVFSTLYAFFYYTDAWKGNQYIALYLLCPPIFYLWGKQISKESQNQIQSFILLILLGLLYSLPGLISVVINIYEGGFVQAERNLPMFWGGDPINATGMASLFMLNMCIPGLIIAGYKHIPKVLQVVFLIVFVLSIASVLRLGSRTQLGIMLIALFISLLFVTPRLSFKQNVFIYTILTGVLIGLINYISFDLDSDIFTSFSDRMGNRGMDDIRSGGGRTGLWKKSLDNMIEKPLGWGLEEFGYSHNLWLDTLRVGGVCSAFVLIIFFIKVYALLFKVLINKSLSIFNRLIFLVYNISFFSVFMVEPGIDGSYNMFLFFCLFTGIMLDTHKLNKNDDIPNES